MISSILIVEDIPETILWLENLVNQVFSNATVHKAENMTSALRLCSSEVFDLALIDLSLPDGDGFAVFRKLSAKQPDTVKVAATVMGSDSAIVSALSAGAQGYILKSDPEEMIKKHLSRILDGIPPLSPAVARRVMEHFRLTGPIVEPNDCLTKRETQVLAHIAKGLRVSDTALALNVAESTVSSHIKAVYQKLDISSRAEATTEATRMGLLNFNND
jgi:DNA-binding NarL/FixJ family response regulator